MHPRIKRPFPLIIIEQKVNIKLTMLFHEPEGFLKKDGNPSSSYRAGKIGRPITVDFVVLYVIIKVQEIRQERKWMTDFQSIKQKQLCQNFHNRSPKTFRRRTKPK